MFSAFVARTEGEGAKGEQGALCSAAGWAVTGEAGDASAFSQCF